MRPIAVGDVFFSWSLDLPAVVTVLILASAYAAGVVRALRHGATWAWWRTGMFVGLGLGSLTWVTCGVLAVYNRTLFWTLALQITLLVTVIPVALALGDPVGLARSAHLPGSLKCLGILGRALRVVAYPLVGPVVAMASQFLLLFSGYLHAALAHAWVMDLMYANMLVVGCMVVIPVFGADEVLPSWCTDPFKLLFAALDGTIDAIPGICTYASGTAMGRGFYEALHRSWGPQPLHDTHIGGGLMITVAEVLGLPTLLVLFARWVRTDRQHAQAWDASLDRTASTAARQSQTRMVPANVERPWWTTDPRFRNPRE
ncbi:MAG: cytochrome c oxidase assembly protein [Acidimicrobiales bacterium]